jgi:beta-phosphoglucomutase-like phosphatase (HAD superfamily)
MYIPMVGEVDAVLFDFEGTLVDFQWKLAEAVAEALEMLRGMGFPKDGIRSRKYSTLMTEATQMRSGSESVSFTIRSMRTPSPAGRCAPT